MHTLLTILLVIPPGLLRTAIEAHLRVNSEVQILPDGFALVDVRDLIFRYQPQVLVIDVDLNNSEMIGLIRETQNQFPAMNCIVLTDSIRQQSLALSCGARHALLKGMLDSCLDDAIYAPPDRNYPDNSKISL